MSVLRPSPRLLAVADHQPVGFVINVNRSQATVEFEVTDSSRDEGTTVGNFLGICKGPALVISAIISVAQVSRNGARTVMRAEVDLLGEIKSRYEAGCTFNRGITFYPAVGDHVRTLLAEDLEIIFAIPEDESIMVGTLHQDPSIEARINVQNLLTKHFAVLGTTGVGKSSGVALILQRISQSQTNLRTFLIDPHNEYGRCFGEDAQVLNPTNLRLPFWLFSFEEFVDVVFRGRPGVEEEVAILAEIIPLARAAYDALPGAPDGKALRRPATRSTTFTIDTPVPYRMADMLSLIDERMGKLENRSQASRFSRLISRIETVRSDRRYAFMFDSANVGGDTMVEVVSTLFRLPPGSGSMTVMQLAGFPTEVVDSVVSVVCRMAFDFGLWSDGAFPLLFVCEEAHRYAPADRTVGFGPTRKALSRIAKEGRKYGVFLGLISQRAGELDATILSQCSTIFAMRMGNEQDQRIIRSAVSDAAANLLGFVPTLGTREVFAFGEGAPLPLRFFFDSLPASMLPKGEAVQQDGVDLSLRSPLDIIAAAVERWRGSGHNARRSLDVQAGDFDAPDPPVLRVPQAPDRGSQRTSGSLTQLSRPEPAGFADQGGFARRDGLRRLS